MMSCCHPLLACVQDVGSSAACARLEMAPPLVAVIASIVALSAALHWHAYYLCIPAGLGILGGGISIYTTRKIRVLKSLDENLKQQEAANRGLQVRIRDLDDLCSSLHQENGTLQEHREHLQRLVEKEIPDTVSKAIEVLKTDLNGEFKVVSDKLQNLMKTADSDLMNMINKLFAEFITRSMQMLSSMETKDILLAKQTEDLTHLAQGVQSRLSTLTENDHEMTNKLTMIYNELFQFLQKFNVEAIRQDVTKLRIVHECLQTEVFELQEVRKTLQGCVDQLKNEINGTIKATGSVLQEARSTTQRVRTPRRRKLNNFMVP